MSFVKNISIGIVVLFLLSLVSGCSGNSNNDALVQDEQNDQEDPENPPDQGPYSVTYVSNGADSGTVPIDTVDYESGDTVNVLGNSGFLWRNDMVFDGWALTPDSEEADYFFYDCFDMGTSDVTLYVHWSDSLVHLNTAYQGIGSIFFPYGEDDDESTYIYRAFSIAETELTNAQAAAIFQWAYDNGKFSDTVTDPDGIDNLIAKHGANILLDIDLSHCNFDVASHTFSVDSGYENHPLTYISWYGAVMLCNWLTEMEDGSDANIVYQRIDDDWGDFETIENAFNTGYRLPLSEEWEYAARYLGTTVPTVEPLATDSVALNNNYLLITTDGYFWTPGDYASGAAADITDSSACQVVAVFDQSITSAVGMKTGNTLGLRDMSGNVWEWCFTASGPGRVFRGGSFHSDAGDLGIGSATVNAPISRYSLLGLRLCRSR